MNNIEIKINAQISATLAAIGIKERSGGYTVNSAYEKVTGFDKKTPNIDKRWSGKPDGLARLSTPSDPRPFRDMESGEMERHYNKPYEEMGILESTTREKAAAIAAYYENSMYAVERSAVSRRIISEIDISLAFDIPLFHGETIGQDGRPKIGMVILDEDGMTAIRTASKAANNTGDVTVSGEASLSGLRKAGEDDVWNGFYVKISDIAYVLITPYRLRSDVPVRRIHIGTFPSAFPFSGMEFFSYIIRKIIVPRLYLSYTWRDGEVVINNCVADVDAARIKPGLQDHTTTLTDLNLCVESTHSHNCHNKIISDIADLVCVLCMPPSHASTADYIVKGITYGVESMIQLKSECERQDSIAKSDLRATIASSTVASVGKIADYHITELLPTRRAEIQRMVVKNFPDLIKDMPIARAIETAIVYPSVTRGTNIAFLKDENGSIKKIIGFITYEYGSPDHTLGVKRIKSRQTTYISCLYVLPEYVNDSHTIEASLINSAMCRSASPSSGGNVKFGIGSLIPISGDFPARVKYMIDCIKAYLKECVDNYEQVKDSCISTASVGRANCLLSSFATKVVKFKSGTGEIIDKRIGDDPEDSGNVKDIPEELSKQSKRKGRKPHGSDSSLTVGNPERDKIITYISENDQKSDEEYVEIHMPCLKRIRNMC